MPDMCRTSFHWSFREILIPVPVDGLKIVPILCSATPNTPFSMILPCFRSTLKRRGAERLADTSLQPPCFQRIDQSHSADLSCPHRLKTAIRPPSRAVATGNLSQFGRKKPLSGHFRNARWTVIGVLDEYLHQTGTVIWNPDEYLHQTTCNLHQT